MSHAGSFASSTSPADNSAHTMQTMLQQLMQRMDALAVAVNDVKSEGAVTNKNVTALQADLKSVAAEVETVKQQQQQQKTANSATNVKAVTVAALASPIAVASSSPGSATPSAMQHSAASPATLLVNPAQQAANPASSITTTVHSTIDSSVINAELNVHLLAAGAKLTARGAMMKDGKKLKPAARYEKDLRPIAQQLTINVRSLASKDDRIMMSSVLTTMGITWPQTVNLDASNVNFPAFPANAANSVALFRAWQSKIIDECKRVGVVDVLLKPLDLLYNIIVSKSFSVSNSTSTDEIKVALVRAMYETSNSLFYLLKATLQNERMVLANIVAAEETNAAMGTGYYIEGNVNFLWRWLDDLYHRITADAIDEANNAFQLISYGTKGNTWISFRNTSKLINDVLQANQELSYVDKPRTDSAMRSLIGSRLPTELWKYFTSVHSGHDAYPYAKFCETLLDCSRSLEERANTDVHGIAHVGAKSRAGSNKKLYCKVCGKDNHDTEDHHECPKCGRPHSPESECRRKATNNNANSGDSNSKEGGSGKSVKRSSAQQLKTADGKTIYGCCTVTVRETGNEVAEVYFSANGVPRLDADRTFVVDSGGAAHIACSERYLFNVRALDSPVYISLPNGASIACRKVGRMMLNKSMWIDHVLLVPNFRTNILSVHLLKKRGFDVLLNEDNGRIVPLLSSGEHAPVFAPVSVEGNVYVLRMPAHALSPPHDALRFSNGVKPEQFMTGPAFLKNAEFVDHSGKKVNKPTTVKITSQPTKPKTSNKSKTADKQSPADSTERAKSTVASSVSHVKTAEHDAASLPASADTSDDE